VTALYDLIIIGSKPYYKEINKVIYVKHNIVGTYMPVVRRSTVVIPLSLWERGDFQSIPSEGVWVVVGYG